VDNPSKPVANPSKLVAKRLAHQSTWPGIYPVLASQPYSSLDHLAALVASLGKGSLLVKTDGKEAYRTVPVHTEDQHLLGVHWEGSLYVDKVLPFGLSSARKIFTALTDALQWIDPSS